MHPVAKKYYKDQYKKTGIIPGPLLLAEKSIMEGRKCSGRPLSMDEQTIRRFKEMVKASCDPSSRGFIFITQKARTLKNYHYWLEKEMNKSISLAALFNAFMLDCQNHHRRKHVTPYASHGEIS